MVGNDASVTIRIRLWRVDCPERKSSEYPKKAKALTIQLFQDKLVEVTLNGRGWFRLFAAIFKVDEKSVAHELLLSGLAW